MSEEFLVHYKDMLNCAVQLLSSYFQKTIHFSKVTQLSEPGRRNLILRLEISTPTALMPQTIILKKTAFETPEAETHSHSKNETETEHEQLSRFAHDWAGIEFLTKIGGNHAPLFYAGSVDHKFILIEDLGLMHPSLVGPLTRAATPENVKIAENALIHYVERLGRMHSDTAGKNNEFSSILKGIYPQAQRYHSFPEQDISALIKLINKLISYSSKDLEIEIHDICEYAQANNDFKVLLHGDICPDNVYYQHNTIQLIDFEFSDYGNALIDGSYLRMYMPSCWCSKTFPVSIIDKMESIYRKALKKNIVSVNNDDEYNKQLTYACAYWILRCLQVLEEMNLIEQEFIGSSGPVDSDSLWDPDKNAARPRILSRLDSYLLQAKSTGYLPNFTKAAVSILYYLRKIWPDTKNMDLYPVFS